MKILIFDTETSGLQAGYNVILQLSYQIVETSDWSVLKSVNHYFSWPEESFRVDDRAIEVNGLTKDFLSRQQLSDKAKALQEFNEYKSQCELLVAHNIEFDKKFIVEECREYDIRYAAAGWGDSYDTMKKTTNICCLYKSWGSGYKYPKLSELADFLNVKTDDLNLHDSSADVELTKRCFRSLVELGYYSLPNKVETGISIKLHVEDEKDYSFTYFDDKGETYSEDSLIMIYGKKAITDNKKRVVELFCTTTNEENDQTRYALKSAPDILDISAFQEQLNNLKPNLYTPAIFSGVEPNKDAIETSLMEEAKKLYNSILFWTNGKKRQSYVDERLDKQYKECLNQYLVQKSTFEREEAEKKKSFDERAMEEYNLRKKSLQGLIDGDMASINVALAQTPDYTLPLLGVIPTATAVSSSDANIELRLPRISELPKVYGSRLASGNYKIKNYSDKDLHAFYADYVIGMAFYMAASYFNMAPTLTTIKVTGIGTNEVTLKQEKLYSVTLTREDLSTMNRQANAIDAIEAYPHEMSLSKSFIFKPI